MTMLAKLDELPDVIGHIPLPIADYLEWVLFLPRDNPARTELLRVIEEVTR